jgi:3-hydroxymyristoyl/3-hydroxydecanoyl-(acyl carrier protein) dehydratase
MSFTIPHHHPSLPGHFPGRPVVPGVVVLDRVVAAIEAAHGPMAAMRLPQVKFVQPLLPGERADIAIEAIGSEGDAGRWRFRVTRDGATIASGDIVSGEGA